MSKYGSGVSMKTVIESELAQVGAILNGRIPDADREAVLDSLREMAYQWCSANATACAMETVMKERHPDTYDEFLRTFLQNPKYHEVYAQKMRDTFLDFDEE